MAENSKKRSADEVVDNLSLYDDQNELINAVISVLAVPENKTAVAEKYANDKNQATEVQAYAKIAGNNWTFYVKSLSISIGRNTEPGPNTNNSETQVDIDLGPAKVVSRQHASINYNLNTRIWELFVTGRNGAKIDGSKIPYGPDSSPSPLYSGAVIDIGATQMMFILPDAQPKISTTILNSLSSKLPKPKNKRLSTVIPSFNSNGSTTNFNSTNSIQSSSNNNLKGFQMYNNNDSDSESNNGGSKHDNDLSTDEARDIKPPYSYATMITQAILSNPEGVLSLSEIYDWISSHYAYYRFSKSGWQNSIRHNLSLNKAFEKVPRRANEPGKGMKWQIADSYKDEFMKKFQNGSLSKVRRGSSVSRQLQLHLALHSDLPASQAAVRRNNNKPPIMHQQFNPNSTQYQQTPPTSSASNGHHQLPPQAPTSGHAPHDALSFMAAAATSSSHHHQPYSQYQGAPQSQGAGAYNQGYYIAPPQLPPLQQQQQQQPQQSQQSSSESQYPQHIPTAPQSAHFPTSGGILQPLSQQQQQQQQQQPTAPPSFNSSSIRPSESGTTTADQTKDSQPNTQLSSPIKNEKTPIKNFYNGGNYFNEDENVSPVKSFVSAVEAYTPDRGAKPQQQQQGNNNNQQQQSQQSQQSQSQQQQNGQNNNSNSALQSSPALWNFVQFSTPLQPKEQTTPTKNGQIQQQPGDSPLVMRQKVKDLGDLSNVDLAKGFKK